MEKHKKKVEKNKPEIHFKDEFGLWQTWKIGDILTEKSRSISLEDNKDYQLVTVKRRNEGVVSRGKLKGKNILVKNYFEVKEGDYIISKRQVVHGANGIIPKSLHKAVVSNEYLVATSNENITTQYWTLISMLPQMHKIFFLSSYGVDIEKLVFDVNDWKKRVLTIPDINQQNRITEFFETLDKLLKEHKQKHNKLKALKKAMLAKMFPQQSQTSPEIRFKGFVGDWEKIKLGDKVPVRGGYAFKSICFRKEGVPIVKISNILATGEVGGDFYFYDEIDKDIDISLPNGSAVIAMSGATTGKVSILKISENEKVYQNQRVGYFENKDLIDYSFISTLVKSSLFERKMKSVLVAGAQPNVSPKQIDSFEFLIPDNKEEQRKIGEYFNNLDKLISNHNIQIKKLNNIKKAFLAKMFI
ncbi:restriction endonuclease subunit S [Flavobacterium sp. Root186]|uniref:restriction endonuclease subunit S n=1 Tax=Flavobacterium sp. Root186 TaxID=1736485 RepID=UPI0006F8C113|nr:restriction endonuclease subunit S [Flavobacterium sp. Root186]KRB55488.1 hypothetical protein ASD98_12475 [Flavobacterium sp. Root186]